MFYVQEYRLSHSMMKADALIAATTIRNSDTLCTATENHYRFIPRVSFKFAFCKRLSGKRNQWYISTRQMIHENSCIGRPVNRNVFLGTNHPLRERELKKGLGVCTNPQVVTKKLQNRCKTVAVRMWLS